MKTYAILDSGLPRTRCCTLPAQSPWAARNLGEGPRVEGTRQLVLGEATKRVLLRATGPPAPTWMAEKP